MILLEAHKNVLIFIYFKIKRKIHIRIMKIQRGKRKYNKNEKMDICLYQYSCKISFLITFCLREGAHSSDNVTLRVSGGCFRLGGHRGPL